MTTALIALGALAAWLLILFLVLGLARSAARGDVVVRRSVAERLRHPRHRRPAA